MISSIANIAASTAVKATDSKDAASGFGDMLKNMVNQTNQLQTDADTATTQFASGQVNNVHDVIIATEKASMAMDLTIQVRNKLQDAYKEIMSMQV